MAAEVSIAESVYTKFVEMKFGEEVPSAHFTPVLTTSRSPTFDPGAFSGYFGNYTKPIESFAATYTASMLPSPQKKMIFET